MLKNIRATNKNGESILFDRRFRITKGLDLSGVQADVNSTEGTSPGSNYQNTRIRDRYFDLEFKVMRGSKDEIAMDNTRELLYIVFNPELNPIRFDFQLSGGAPFYFEAHLESTPIMPTDKVNNNLVWQSALLHFKATDPFIYSSSPTVVDIANWVGAFEFPLEITEEGIELGYRSQSLVKNVYNGGGSEVGMIIEFKSTASVVNPSLINVNTYEKLMLNTTILTGDLLRVNTNVGKKSAILIRNNVEIDSFHVIDIMSDFLQLKPGDNLFRYDAEDGLDNLEVRMIFREKYLGV